MPRKPNERKPASSNQRARPAPARQSEHRTASHAEAAHSTPVAPAQERQSPPNHIYIGKKPVMGYAMSALIQLAQAGEITIKARGLAISRAVDVAQVVTKRLGNGTFSIKDVRIDTEVVGEGQEMRNVSSIEIVVAK